jgi:hypothetical protein
MPSSYGIAQTSAFDRKGIAYICRIDIFYATFLQMTFSSYFAMASKPLDIHGISNAMKDAVITRYFDHL